MHRLYLGDVLGARNLCITLGGCVIGWFRDGWKLRSMVDEVNGGGGSKVAGSTTRCIQAMSKLAAGTFPGNRVSNTKYGSTNMEMAVKFIPLSFAEQMERWGMRTSHDHVIRCSIDTHLDDTPHITQ